MPGFVKVLDDTRLLIPDVAGNRLFQSYLNMTDNPHVGLIFFIPGIGDTVRVNGTMAFVSKEELARLEIELEVHNPDDNSKVQQGIMVKVEEAYRALPQGLGLLQALGLKGVGRLSGKCRMIKPNPKNVRGLKCRLPKCWVP